MKRLLLCSTTMALFLGLALSSCADNANDCEKNLEPCPGDGGETASGGSAGSTSTTTTTGDGGGGEGGAGGCSSDADCTEPGAAKCEAGSCVACDDSSQCAGILGAEVCHEGSCVECSAADESACSDTCNLLENTCTGAPESSLSNCEACTNDLQCPSGHRCVPMDFQMQPHGYYCLEEAGSPPDCVEPFLVLINETSLGGEPATDYCSLAEDLTTCEAYHALKNSWHCTGTDGMCSETMGGNEVAVPGALCRTVGGGQNRCTYACGSPDNCPSEAPQDTCGDQGTNTDPDWCGG